MNKILYYMGLISEVLFLIMVIFLLPFIIKSDWQGRMFLSVSFVFIALRLFVLLARKAVVQKNVIYNILIVALTCYLGIIFTRVMLIQLHPSVLYELSIEYCQNNFFLISITMICIILNTIMLLFVKEEG